MAGVTYTLGDLARRIDARIEGDASVVVTGLGSIEHAHPGDLTHLSSRAYRRFLAQYPSHRGNSSRRRSGAMPNARAGRAQPLPRVCASVASVQERSAGHCGNTSHLRSVDPSAQIGAAVSIGAKRSRGRAMSHRRSRDHRRQLRDRRCVRTGRDGAVDGFGDVVPTRSNRRA